MVFSYGYRWEQNQRQKKYTSNAGDFDCHTNAEVRCKVHPLVEHIQGLTRSRWMLPSGECLHRIAPAAVMVGEFVKTQNTNKKLLLASNYGTNWSLVFLEIFLPQNKHFTQLVNVSCCVKMWDATIGAEELAHISLKKFGKVTKPARS